MPGKRAKKRKLNKPRFALFIVILLAIFCGGFALANNVLWPVMTGDLAIGSMDDEDSGADLSKLDGLNILMMGVDERTEDKSLRTDTMILANINNKDNRISLLSIPRDTKVSIPGHGTNKINSANLFGGPEMAMNVVSDITGVPIDYYVITNFNGFKGIVDALGGVTVDVEKDMHYHEAAYGGEYNIDLNKGVQRLDGDQALMYARFRHDALGDITRTQRQLKILTAIGQEAMQPKVVTKLPKLIPQVYKNIETNMGLKQMVTMAKAAKNIENVQIVSQTLPGWFLNERGASYWYVDPGNAKEVARALFEEGKVVDVVKGEMSGSGSSPNKQVAMDQPKAQPVVEQPKTQPAPTQAAPENTAGAKQPVQKTNKNTTTTNPENNANSPKTVQQPANGTVPPSNDANAAPDPEPIETEHHVEINVPGSGLN